MGSRVVTWRMGSPSRLWSVGGDIPTTVSWLEKATHSSSIYMTAPHEGGADWREIAILYFNWSWSTWRDVLSEFGWEQKKRVKFGLVDRWEWFYVGGSLEILSYVRSIYRGFCRLYGHMAFDRFELG
ncbi:hypothetical protein CRG98_027909 [Punica granatum]|uniref:Uncharacterized protein n=1 Tax=Punica granatum TaxID=22663 RepID=A0A2I0J7U5_PUNGR|nr:hypothetical protein CRG98_027909 [Punica granatum]